MPMIPNHIHNTVVHARKHDNANDKGNQNDQGHGNDNGNDNDMVMT